jgi:hypothetical protein
VNSIEAYEDLLMWFAADLHEAIRAAIPSLVDLLKDGGWGIQSAAVSGVVKLAKHGKFD